LSTAPIHVLVIDDDEDDFILVRDTLRDITGIRYVVVWANNVAVAHEILQAADTIVDVCLLDYDLGSTTGLEFLKDALTHYPHLPFILLTGYNNRDIDVQAMQQGISDYLPKAQLNASLLERTIRYSIERGRTLLKLQQNAEELEAKNRELDAYTHMIAHSLRSPLGLFTANAGLIRLNDKDRLAPDSLEMLDEIETQAMKLANIISQLLVLARVRDAAEMITEVEMSPLIATVCKRFDHLIRERQVQLEISDELLPVMGHEAWIEEVLSNLISNALKYLGADNLSPKVTIRSYLEDSHVVYEVIDNGIGIDLKNDKYVFEMFSRIKSKETAEVDGTGIGLSVVRRLIEKMNGQVGVRSQLGEGSTFWFMLPAPESIL
jgi:signal transduction histidine kinase